MIAYFDTSAVVPLFVDEDSSDAVKAWIDDADPTIRVTTLLTVEFSSAIARRHRRGDISASEVDRAEASFSRWLGASTPLASFDRHHFVMARHFVRRHDLGLRTGDALHLAFAATEGCLLVSLDKILNAAARAVGVSSFDPMEI